MVFSEGRSSWPVSYTHLAYKDFYYENSEHIRPEHGELAQWLTGNKKFQKYWQYTMKELVDRFHPALLYSDSGLPFEEEGYQPGLDAVSYLYNDSIERLSLIHI